MIKKKFKKLKKAEHRKHRSSRLCVVCTDTAVCSEAQRQLLLTRSEMGVRKNGV